MVAFSYRENFHFLTTQNTDLLGFLGDWWIHVVEKAQVKFYVISRELDPRRPKRLCNERLNCGVALKDKVIGWAGRCSSSGGGAVLVSHTFLLVSDFISGILLLYCFQFCKDYFALIYWRAINVTCQFEAPKERLQSAKAKRRTQYKKQSSHSWHINFNVILLQGHTTLILQHIIIKTK